MSIIQSSFCAMIHINDVRYLPEDKHQQIMHLWPDQNKDVKFYKT